MQAINQRTPARLVASNVTKRASVQTTFSTYNGMKACGAQTTNSRVSVLTARPMATRATGRSTAVIECRKVAILGAAGGIGQPVSLLMKMNRLVTDLALYDIANVAGVAADLSHCNTPVQVKQRLNHRQLFLSLTVFDELLIFFLRVVHQTTLKSLYSIIIYVLRCQNTKLFRY